MSSVARLFMSDFYLRIRPTNDKILVFCNSFSINIAILFDK